jgi:desumoylating isopeptidase 1
MISYVTNRTSVPYPLRLVTLQAVCNLFTSALFPRHLTSPHLSHLLTPLITTSLLDKAHSNSRVAAASLVFNLAIYIQKQRAVHNEEVLEDVELIAAVIETIKEEDQSKEVVKGLVLGLALMLYCAPLDSEALDVAKVLEAGTVIREKGAKGGLGDKALCDEIAELLEV